jgi:hypothetical protein
MQKRYHSEQSAIFWRSLSSFIEAEGRWAAKRGSEDKQTPSSKAVILGEGPKMRFITFRDGQGRGRGGLCLENGKYDGLYEEEPGDFKLLIRAGQDCLSGANVRLLSGKRLDASTIEFLPSLTNPGKIICIGLNCAHHSAESAFTQSDYCWDTDHIPADYDWASCDHSTHDAFYVWRLTPPRPNSRQITKLSPKSPTVAWQSGQARGGHEC